MKKRSIIERLLAIEKTSKKMYNTQIIMYIFWSGLIVNEVKPNYETNKSHRFKLWCSNLRKNWISFILNLILYLIPVIVIEPSISKYIVGKFVCVIILLVIIFSSFLLYFFKKLFTLSLPLTDKTKSNIFLIIP